MSLKAQKIGLYFGSFNPIHIGHLIIANHFLNFSDLDQLWFVISPHSPFKEKKSLLEDHHRLNMVKIAIDDNSKFRASDIEFSLPQPSFTVHTLAALTEKYPEKRFQLVMGSDNLIGFERWKNYEEIINNYRILVYPRPGRSESALINHPQVSIVKAPLMEISSSFIRKCIAEGISVQYLVKPEVRNYIDEMNFYKD